MYVNATGGGIFKTKDNNNNGTASRRGGEIRRRCFPRTKPRPTIIKIKMIITRKKGKDKGMPLEILGRE